MTSRIRYGATPEFEKEFGRLEKKYRTLALDLERAKSDAIELLHVRGLDNLSIFSVVGGKTDAVQIYILKKFACRALKGRGLKSGIRIVYAFHPVERRVVFLEIFFKGDQEKESAERYQRYLKGFVK